MIGVYGLDVETQEVKIPSANTDIMGYCDARFWISDYNFSAIFAYRVSHPSASIAPAVPSLVVWGRIENGAPVLEPAFEATTVPSLPETMGPYVVEGRDAAGQMIFSMPFAAEGMPDVATDVRHFAFAVPLSIEQSARIATLKLIARGKESVLRAPTSALLGANGVRRPATQALASVVKTSPTRASVRWDASAYPLVVVRDVVTGSILSLARGGTASVAMNDGHDVELIVSDGIHSLANRSSLNFANKLQR